MFYLRLIFFLVRLIVLNFLFLSYFFAYQYKRFFKVVIIWLLIIWQSVILIGHFLKPAEVITPPLDIKTTQLAQLLNTETENLEIPLLEKNSKLLELENLYQTKLLSSPTHRDLLINLALINWAQNDVEPAKLYLNQAIYQDPQAQFFTDNQGLVQKILTAE